MALRRHLRFLVALAPVRDLLLCAKHLFVAAMVCLGCGGTWLNEGGANWPQAMSARWDKRFRAAMERALLAQRPAATLPPRRRRARK